MSYCVHCGVKLAPTEKVCPLCGTPVIDPNASASDEKNYEPLFPNRIQTDDKVKINIKFLAFVIGLLLLIPLGAVLLIDIFTNHSVSWSLYVLGAELCIWAFIVLPLIAPNHKVYLYVGVDFFAAAFYTLLIGLALHSIDWYLRLVLPLFVSICIFTMLCLLICRAKVIGKIEKVGWLIIAAAVQLLSLDMLIVHFITKVYDLTWSWYASFPLIVLGIVILIFSKNRRISDWIRKKLFI